MNGIFYESALSAYNASDEAEYKIEKVVGKNKIKNKNYILVKYKGWPDKFNEWILDTNIITK